MTGYREVAEMVRRIYPNPPIIEAVIELRFVDAVSRQSLVDGIADHQRESYAGARKTQERFHLTAKLEAGASSSDVVRETHAEFLTSTSGLRVIGCRDGALSFHVLAPYPGWENFRDHVLAVLDMLPAELGNQPVAAVAVRYIDRIELPAGELQLEDFFTIVPKLPTAGPQPCLSLDFVVVRAEPDQGIETALALRLEPPTADGRPALSFDFLAVQQCEGAPAARELVVWWPEVEALHELQRDSFEACITDKCRELFQ